MVNAMLLFFFKVYQVSFPQLWKTENEVNLHVYFHTNFTVYYQHLLINGCTAHGEIQP